MMKIVYVSQAFIPSQTANSIHIMNMCNAFSVNGHEVILFAPDCREEYPVGVEDIFDYYGVNNRFTLVKLPFLHPRENSYRYLLSTFTYCLHILLKLLKIKPDLVYGRYLPGCYVAAKLGTPTIFEAHDLVWRSRLENVIFKKIVREERFIKLIVISEALKDIYLEAGLLNSQQIQVAPDSADEVPDFEPLTDWPGRNGCLQVGYVGNLYSGRGIEMILALASSLNDVDFHIVGGSEKDLVRFREKYDFPNLYIHGYVPPKETYKYRNSCDILLAGYGRRVSLREEAADTSKYMSPLKIFEYMSSRKPIIASDLPVLREVLSPRNAMLVPPDDSEGWKAAIIRLGDVEARNKLAAAAYEDFLKHHTWAIRARNVIS
jgi:glycosyltransferase involved in cell wall biosynthesis